MEEETQKEEDHHLEEIQEEEVGEDPCTDTIFLEEDKHHRTAMANS